MVFGEGFLRPGEGRCLYSREFRFQLKLLAFIKILNIRKALLSKILTCNVVPFRVDRISKGSVQIVVQRVVGSNLKELMGK